MAGLGSILSEGLKGAVGSLPGTLINAGAQFLTGSLDRGFQREMVDRANEYNSPRNQARLMQQGGFSPAALFGQNGSSIAQMQSPSVGSHSFAPITPDSLMNPFSSVAQALQSLSQANKNVAELPLIQANIQKLFSEANLNDSYSALNKFTDKMNQIYGSQLKRGEVREKFAHANQLSAQAELFAIQGETEKARKLLAQSQSAYYDSMKGLTDEQVLQAKMETQYHVARIRSEIEGNRAQALAHREQANLSHEQSVMQSLENNIKKATNSSDIFNALFNADVITVLQQSNNREEIWQELQRNLIASKAYKEGDFSKHIETVLERLAKIVGIKTSVTLSPK